MNILKRLIISDGNGIDSCVTITKSTCTIYTRFKAMATKQA